jgi:hypothetical protein
VIALQFKVTQKTIDPTPLDMVFAGFADVAVVAAADAGAPPN